MTIREDPIDFIKKSIDCCRTKGNTESSPIGRDSYRPLTPRQFRDRMTPSKPRPGKG